MVSQPRASGLSDIEHIAFEFIPITQYFSDLQSARGAGRLDHGFPDMDPPVPSFEELYKRTVGLVPQYHQYTTYLLVTEPVGREKEPIGVLAVQRTSHDEITRKLVGVEPPFEGTCLYLSWIVLHKSWQRLRLFKLLFVFYETLLKRLRAKTGQPVYGAAKAVRRLRYPFYLISGSEDRYVESNDTEFRFRGRQVEFWGIPGEVLNPETYAGIDCYYIRIVTEEDRGCSKG